MLIRKNRSYTLQWTGVYDSICDGWLLRILLALAAIQLLVRARSRQNSVTTGHRRKLNTDVNSTLDKRSSEKRISMVTRSFRLDGKNALVTGSSRRPQSAAIAIALAQGRR
jgi:hypothetical protein